MLKKIIDTVTAPFKPMYAIKPDLSDPQHSQQPYKFYKVNFLGDPKPKNDQFGSHRYSAVATATDIYSCLNNWHKVLILKGKEGSDAHAQRQHELLELLNARTAPIVYEIKDNNIEIRGTRSSGEKREWYNEIVPKEPIGA